MASADSSQFVVTTADETACETSTLKVRTLSPHLSATSTRTSGNFWTSSLLADLSVFPSLICDFCPSDQGFAYSFFQIPPHDGHPCCSAIHFLVAQACSGLSPVRARPWRANQKNRKPFLDFLSWCTVLCNGGYSVLVYGCSSKRNLNNAATSRDFMLSSVSLSICPFSMAAIRIRLL